MKRFEKLFYDELERNPDAKTVWELALNVLTSKTDQDKILMFLKADLDIMKLIVEGHSAYSISNILGIQSKDVFAVANMWGFHLPRESLDVNPAAIYEAGMKSTAFKHLYDMLVPVHITEDDAKNAIHNIERYNDVVKYLEEEDK